MLEATCRVARGKFQENSKVLGIATEKHIAPECSYSFCLLELAEWTDESQALMDEIQREFADRFEIPYLETSARSGVGVEEAFKQLANQIATEHVRSKSGK